MGRSFFDWLTPEDHLQKAVCNYLDTQYPKIKWYHAANEGKRSPFERFKAKYLGLKSGVPDICICAARNGYHGLYIELKALTMKPGKRDKMIIDYKGKLSEEQKVWLADLEDEGYKAVPAWGFDETKAIIDESLKKS